MKTVNKFSSLSVYRLPRTFFLSLLVLLLSFALVSAEDRRQDKTTLSIMTLNAEFLWDGVEPEEGTVTDVPWRGSQTEAEEHMRRVAELVVASNPDILNLVEVENIDALKTFNDKFLSGRGYEPYLINGKDFSTGQDVALLTRIDPEGKKIERDDRSATIGNVKKTVSKNYYAKIPVGDTKIALIGLHFLAMPLREDRKLQREAQAEIIRRLAVEKALEGYQVVVLGDFNDYDGDDCCRDHIDSAPISNVLSTIKSMAPGDSSDDLTNASSFVPKAGRYTSHYDKNNNGRVDPPVEFTSIDHILISPGLKGKVQVVEMPHNHDPLQVTDHFPVIVRFILAGGEAPTAVSQARISYLLPNPTGNETLNEEAMIRNTGSNSIDLSGWTLRDLSGKTWQLDSLGVLAPGEEKTLKRNGMAMSLNNTGDTINLVDNAGIVRHTVTYGKVDEGEVVTPAD